MADEIDGLIAFNEVLDRLIDAEIAARGARLEISSLQQQVADARQERDRIGFEHGKLQEAIDRDRPKLSAHEACDQIPF